MHIILYVYINKNKYDNKVSLKPRYNKVILKNVEHDFVFEVESV